jgi:hypothetical protein
MDTRLVLLAIIVAVCTMLAVFWWASRPANAHSGVGITSTIKDGRTQFDSNLDLPRSKDETRGITFSYACWIKVNDFSYRYGEPKVVFTKGPTDLTMMCPALLLDPNTNSLIVKIDTFGGTEILPIGNIPAKKWIHFAVAIAQDSVDIYVNGTLYLHHTLVNMPKQNAETVHTSIAGGFDGQIAGLTYYGYLLDPSSIKSIMGQTPQTDPTVDAPLPPYFGTDFWVRHA